MNSDLIAFDPIIGIKLVRLQFDPKREKEQGHNWVKIHFMREERGVLTTYREIIFIGAGCIFVVKF